MIMGRGRSTPRPPDGSGLEHGPVDFFGNPDALDPAYQFQLAHEGRFSAIALHIGLAEKYTPPVHRRRSADPEIEWKDCGSPDHAAFSALTGSVEDAVRLGADAVGYTVYVGSPAQDRDFDQFRRVRLDAERVGDTRDRLGVSSRRVGARRREERRASTRSITPRGSRSSSGPTS